MAPALVSTLAPAAALPAAPRRHGTWPSAPTPSACLSLGLRASQLPPTPPLFKANDGRRQTAGLAAMGPNKRGDWGHIGRIMETVLGEELVDSKWYTTCQALNQKCWVYSKRGTQQVSKLGDTCTYY